MNKLNLTVTKEDGVCTQLNYVAVPDESFAYTKLEIEVQVDCCCETHTYVVYENTSQNLASTAFSVTPANLGMTGFTNGVYTTKLTATNVNTGSYRVINSCDFVDCDLQCKIFEAMDPATPTKNLEIQAYYNALKLTGDCEPCDCEDACAMWTIIKDNLNINCPTCG